MGWKSVTQKMEYLKNKYPSAFRYYNQDSAFLRDHGTKNYDQCHVFIDLNTILIPTLFMLTDTPGLDVTGKAVVEPILKLNVEYMRYCVLHENEKLRNIVNVFDGPTCDRPKIKEDRKIEKDLIMSDEDIEKMVVNDNYFPNIKAFRSNIGNMKFRQRVMGYLSEKIAQNFLNKLDEWSNIIKPRNINLQIINGATREYSNACISIKIPNPSTKIDTVTESKYPCEGEQSIFTFIREEVIKTTITPKKHLCYIISNDSDCILYANEILLRKWKSPVNGINIIQRCKISKRKKKYSFYTINMLHLRSLINNDAIERELWVKKLNSNGVKHFDWAQILLTILGIFYGNDFVSRIGTIKGLENEETLVDPHHPSKKLKKRLFLFESFIDEIRKVINRTKESIFGQCKVNDHEIMYRISETNVISACVRALSNKPKKNKPQKPLKITKLQKKVILSCLKNYRWCMNYFTNPGIPKYLNYAFCYKGKYLFGFKEINGKCYRTLNI